MIRVGLCLCVSLCESILPRQMLRLVEGSRTYRQIMGVIKKGQLVGT